MIEVFLNQKFVGFVEDVDSFINKFKELRGKKIHPEVNIYYDEELNQIHINADSGRALRPLIVVKDGKPLLNEEHIKQLEKGEITWQDLIREGIIQYLDPAEEENILVAFTEEELTDKHTHLEISPLAMFGLLGSMVPYANLTQGTRANFGAKYQKQAIGFYAANYSIRMDMDVNLLHYPQVPIVRSIINEIIGYDKHPVGQNVVVAVMSYEGYNMEDAIIVNKGSIDRGFGRSSYFRPSIAEELRYPGGLRDEIRIPDKDVKGYRSEHDYRHLEDDGIAYVGARVNDGDVVIGKVSPPRFLSGFDEYGLAMTAKRESSVAMAHGEKGVVDSVIVTENEEGNKLVQVMIRDERIPEIGDKFTTRCGQKGIIGLIVPEADMPFTANGIIPDIIFSPHSLPSRMTINHMLEILAGKVGALSGRYIDATTYNAESEEKLRKELFELGFNDAGIETMYDGKTGRQFKVRIFIGNMYYLKLKYLVANKIQARARGPIQLLTRQPTEGRAKEGGLRLGEMEKDTFVAHGAALVLKERFDSDKTLVPVCEHCGHIAIYDSYRNKLYCSICGDDVEINYIEISYAFKLLIEELKSMCFLPKLRLKEKYK